MGISKIEIIVLIALVITLLFVGGKKLPELARGVGEAARELKKGFRDDDDKDSAKKSDEKDKETTK
ncbi:MAG: twin-arginine translocase TatA/TatE family subunit [Ignavibacteria bacterium]|nr:twin-arginine translocase TatA/TatE family subunit [Ignavibacteria bacterium]